MNYEELLEMLDIESPEEFEYFDHLADLVELEEEVEYEGFHQVLSQVSSETMLDLLRNYFTDITEHMPDSTIDIHTLIDEVKKALLGLARHIDEEDGRRPFIDELYRFRNWYALEGEVLVKNMETGERSRVSLSEAIAISRMEALGGDTYDYDFEDCLNYEPEEYSMTINEAMSAAYGDDYDASGTDAMELRDAAEGDQALVDGLVDLDNPMMDDDMSYLN